ncbi:MAG: SDR family NAD(P)-dependent oxidoreductase [Granulosicoccus sp.]
MASIKDNRPAGARSSASNRLAIVTGAQQGIGLAIARALACSGYNIVIADLHTRQSAEFLRERWGCNSRISCLEVDIAKESSVTRLFDSVMQSTDTCPDVLINNAATQVWGPLIDMNLEDWQRTLDVNLTGTFLMTREYARLYRRHESVRGAIVNLGSGCNRLAFPQLSAYAASKGGIEMLTKACALELGEHGIRVNCIAPGAIETERTQAETGNYAQSWSALTPMQRIGTVNDVANAVVALVSDNMRFVSGETINVDGGLFSRAVWPAEY